MRKLAIPALVLLALLGASGTAVADMPTYPTYPAPTLPGKYKVVPCPTHKHKHAVTLRACLRRV